MNMYENGSAGKVNEYIKRCNVRGSFHDGVHYLTNFHRNILYYGSVCVPSFDIREEPNRIINRETCEPPKMSRPSTVGRMCPKRRTWQYVARSLVRLLAYLTRSLVAKWRRTNEPHAST